MHTTSERTQSLVDYTTSSHELETTGEISQTNRERNLDRKRLRRSMRFFRRMALGVIWWEVIVKRIAGEEYVAGGRDERLKKIARLFRELAIEMGGVMIKLGQFISVRVDVMPEILIQELAGLQDEVPPAPTPIMMEMLATELDQSIDSVFKFIHTEPQAAASLGQVYRGKLHDGKHVAVKILRPNIQQLVETDLAALSIVARWFMYWKLVRDRADVPSLLEEFAATLREELDYFAEAENAEKLHRFFQNDPGVYVPKVYPEYSTNRVLIMEDVTAIKVTDLNALAEAGIDNRVVARRVLDIYMRMIFELGFFHADPHPGNLFVYPLPDAAARKMYGRSNGHAGKPFYLILVDFGMCGHITPNVYDGLKEAAIGLGTRDVERIVNSMQLLGVLLPIEDLEPVYEISQETLEFMWGRSPKEIAQMPMDEMHEMAHKYRKLFYDLPFQVPQDFIYLGRAAGMLSGLCTALDEKFNPWDIIAQYARKLLRGELTSDTGGMLTATLGMIGQVIRRN